MATGHRELEPDGTATGHRELEPDGDGTQGTGAGRDGNGTQGTGAGWLLCCTTKFTHDSQPSGLSFAHRSRTYWISLLLVLLQFYFNEVEHPPPPELG